ncbi:uncharacterized protein METZ01_LOCUS62235, partial [marine metagenome]
WQIICRPDKQKPATGQTRSRLETSYGA